MQKNGSIITANQTAKTPLIFLMILQPQLLLIKILHHHRSSYMGKVFKARNRAITLEERRRGSKVMYENYICQYKAILLQCEREYDLMINVRLYQEIVIPFSNVKNGQYAAVALTRS